jgi:hypothetical protein
MRNQYKTLMLVFGLATGLSAQQVPAPSKPTKSAAMGVRDKDKENQVAKLFESIRADAKLTPMKRIGQRDKIEQQTCTFALTDVFPKDNSRSNDTFTIYKTSQPESVSPGLKQVALFDNSNLKGSSSYE